MFLSLPSHPRYNWLLTSVNNQICQCLRWLAWLALALPNVGRCPWCCSWLSPEDRRDLASWQLAMLILFSKIWVDSSREPVCGVTLRVQAGLWGRCVTVHTVIIIIEATPSCCVPDAEMRDEQRPHDKGENLDPPTIRNSQEQVCKLSCWLL